MCNISHSSLISRYGLLDYMFIQVPTIFPLAPLFTLLTNLLQQKPPSVVLNFSKCLKADWIILLFEVITHLLYHSLDVLLLSCTELFCTARLRGTVTADIIVNSSYRSSQPARGWRHLLSQLCQCESYRRVCIHVELREKILSQRRQTTAFSLRGNSRLILHILQWGDTIVLLLPYKSCIMYNKSNGWYL